MDRIDEKSDDEDGSGSMKTVLMVMMIFLLFSGLIIAGCAGQQEVSAPPSVSEPSDAEVLAQYPDHLDTALEELEMVG